MLSKLSVSLWFMLFAPSILIHGERGVQFDIFRAFAGGPLLCAVDSPNASYAVESQLSCCNKCQHGGACTAFNYWNGTARCELFDSLPCNYSQANGCAHYTKRRQSIAIQQNIQGKYTFNKNWAAYKAGFSNTTTGDFWLGNDAIHNLTYNNDYKVRFEVQSKLNGRWYWAEYCTFSVANELAKYQLHVDQYTGTAGDALCTTGCSADTSGYNNVLDGMYFTTYDRDNDVYPGNCANYVNNVGGFWYRACSHVIVNADDWRNTTRGMSWKELPDGVGGYGNLVATRMILLPKRA